MKVWKFKVCFWFIMKNLGLGLGMASEIYIMIKTKSQKVLKCNNYFWRFRRSKISSRLFPPSISHTKWSSVLALKISELPQKPPNHVNNVDLKNLLLTWNMFHTFFRYIPFWFWTAKYLQGYCQLYITGKFTKSWVNILVEGCPAV